ncbi:MAG TPA: SpoIIE family protein phosphatase [Bacillota bacterium]|nr:SpoIIE family protein phosphatase [Bacillota bacterium]
MDHFNIYPYRRVTPPPAPGGNKFAAIWKQLIHWLARLREMPLPDIRKVGISLSVPVLAAAVISFLTGRAVLFQDLHPFAPALAAAVYLVYPQLTLIALLGLSAGLATVVTGTQVWVAIANLVFVWLVLRLVKLESTNEDISLPILVFAATVIVKTVAISLGRPVLFDYVAVLIEALLVGLSAVAFRRGLKAAQEAGPVHKLSIENRICLGVLLLAVLSGFTGLKLAEVSLLGIFSRVVILLAVANGGLGVGAIAGIIVGLVPGMTGGDSFPVSLGVYAFGGLMAGVFTRFGRFGAPLGLLFSNIFWSVYLSTPDQLLLMVLETLVAIGMYWIMPTLSFLTPDELLGQAAALSSFGRDKQVSSRKLNRFAKVFEDLAETFDQLSSEGRLAQWREENLVEKIGEQACVGCSKARICWEKNTAQTRKALWNLVSLVELEGNDVEVPSGSETGHCLHPRELLMAVKCMVSNKSNNQYWQRRFRETHEMVSGQLRGISNIMENLAQETEYQGEIANEVEDAALPLAVEIGAAKVAKDGSLVTGDTYREFFLKKGSFVVALSDGMGSGPEAAAESKATIDLLARLLEAGFPEELAVKTVNSALMLKAEEESFATLDLVIIDLHYGLLQFVKIGAAASFIKRGEKIGLIKSTSLPIGILQQVDADVVKQEVEPGDIIVVMSDGLLESVADRVDKEQWVVDVLVGCRTADPQNLADFLLNKGRQNAGNSVPDDMTVIVIKIIENPAFVQVLQ